LKLNYLSTIFFVCIFNISTAFSQVNIESIRSQNKEAVFWGEVKGGLELQRGNVDITAFDSDILVHFKKNKHHTFLQTKSSQGRQSGNEFKNNSFAHLRWTWMTWKILGFEMFTQIQQDEFKALNIRQLNGIGLRSEIIQSKNLSLSLGTGVMTDYEMLKDRKESTLIRSTSYITMAKSVSKDRKNLILFTLYYQPLFTNQEDYRINLEANVRTILISSWNISLDNTLKYMYDTNPPEDILTNDILIKTSLLYAW